MVDAQLNINLLDGIVFVVLFLSCLLSLFRGFIREFLSLTAWVGAALITLHVLPDVAKAAMPYVNNNAGVALIFATLGTYFTAVVSISILGAIILRYTKDGADVGVVDNILGLLFGFVKGSMIIILGFSLYTQIVSEEGYPEWVKTAYTLPAVKKGAGMMAGMMPGYLRDIALFGAKKEDGEGGIPEVGEPIAGEENSESTDGQENSTGNVFDRKALEDLLNSTEPDKE